jgi:cation transport ATPase
MALDRTARRRRFGALMLLAALGMLIAGQTILKSQLKDLGFLLYWLLCFVFTGAAILIAYLDALALQRRSRREARELLEHTLSEIESDARKKPPGASKQDVQVKDLNHTSPRQRPG